jgi:hypothetical protein
MAQINLDTLPRSRKEALALGSKHYFTGKPCKHGHVAERLTSVGYCCACSRSAQKALQKARMENHFLSVRLDCAQCGATFTPEYGAGKKGKFAKYCGNACRIAADRAIKRQWLEDNQEKRKEVTSRYGKRMRKEKGDAWAKSRACTVAYQKKRLATDPDFRLAHNLRTRYNQALLHGRGRKTTSVTKLAGCSISDLRAHIEAQFQPGMTWDNWAPDGWHLDHIKPIVSFDRPDHPDCWHYSNLQPLWAEDNLKKGARLAA